MQKANFTWLAYEFTIRMPKDLWAKFANDFDFLKNMSETQIQIVFIIFAKNLLNVNNEGNSKVDMCHSSLYFWTMNI